MSVSPVDPVGEIIPVIMTALADVFAPDQTPPPLGGGTDTVRFFAGDAPAMSAWDSHSSNGNNCGEPFIWTRLMRRYRSKAFPSPTISIDCKLTKVIAIEIGVARCAVTDEHPKWSQYELEAAVSRDDSWRIETALCVAMGRFKNSDAQPLVGIDTIVPYGPEGGVLSWSGVIYVSFEESE